MMKDGPNIVAIAALIGDHARAEVLTALMTDRALTATELAAIAGVTKQTISSHLAKLQEAGLIVVEPQGRHRYFRLADPEVAHLLETLMGVAFRTGSVRLIASPREPALRKARVCYDHLAGEYGVLMYEQLLRRRALMLDENGLQLSDVGHALLQALAIDTETLQRGKRTFCRSCLDWSERRHHLAGALGAVLLRRIIELDWARRGLERDLKTNRVVQFSVSGENAWRKWLALP